MMDVKKMDSEVTVNQVVSKKRVTDHGEVYTRQREVFNYFYELKPFNFLFSELQTELENEV